MALQALELDDLDQKVTEAFPGLVVRKDLLRVLRSAYGVPTFVIEFLLGKYCASPDPDVIERGMEFVRRSLSQKYVKPDEREVIRAKIQQEGTYTLIDKVSVVLKEVDDKYWATLHNINQEYVHIDEDLLREHDRLLMGGVWAEVTVRYDASLKFKNVFRPFVIEELKPIQLSSRSIGPVVEARPKFTREEWIDLLIRSLGMEPSHPYFTPRRKLLYLLRLVPLVERNYNLIELGPRGTGKSFVYQQISPYSQLISGGQTTVAQMFVNLANGQKGLVALWDTVAFDEAAGIRFVDKNGIDIMKDYMEDGSFSRGKDRINAEGSIVFVGNLDGDVATIVRTSNLFYPMPKEMDTAFFDRIHAYLPGWELGKTRDEMYTNHFGFVSDYLAEVFHNVRKSTYMDRSERHVEFGSHIGGRDAKAVRKTVSGLVKLIHPDGDGNQGGHPRVRRVRDGAPSPRQGAAQEDGRARVLRRRVLVPGPRDECGDLRRVARERRWPADHRAAVAARGPCTPSAATGPIRRPASSRCSSSRPRSTRGVAGSSRSATCPPTMKEALKVAHAYLLGHLKDLGIDRDPRQYDFTVQAVNLNQAKDGSETAIGFFISLVSALLERPVEPTTVVVGEMSVQGLLQKVANLSERLELSSDSGARRVLIPSENKRDLADVPDSVLDRLQAAFYSDPLNAAIRAMTLE